MTDLSPWWQTGIVYQIYPRSFQDSNADGVGDLPGILRRLDYLQSLGIDAVWLSPVFQSPMDDFGYDISDYCAIHPLFGTMDDFDRLLAEVHSRGMKLLLDLVPNHTSDQHAWFKESRSSRDNPKRNWYIWRDPAPDGGPPNNWTANFGGPAWEYDPHTGQYFLHLFLPSQPDLNYANPEVLRAMLDVMRFWLDKGVDGFRVDVIWMMAKDPEFRDEPPNPDFAPGKRDREQLIHIYTQDVPAVHDYIRAMRQVMDQYDERVMIGEIYLPIDRLITYYGANLDEAHLPFNFHLLTTEWAAQSVRRLVDQYEAALPPDAWPNWVLGNHDRPRIASRVGRAHARLAMMLLLTLRGTPTWYYGDEIGMLDGYIPPERAVDPCGLRQPDIPGLSRDPERTPMQWDAGPNAGFCPPGVEPWLPMAADYREVNVAAQDPDPHSTLALFRHLTRLRREAPALNRGTYRPLDIAAGPTPVFAYVRGEAGARVLVVLNFDDQPHTVDLSAEVPRGDVLLSTALDRAGEEDLARLEVRGNEGVVIRVG